MDGGQTPVVPAAEGTYTVTARVSFKDNTVTYYDKFFGLGRTGQAQVALHEALHLVWGMRDETYAKALGVYKDGMSGSAASEAWNAKLKENCK